MNKLKHLAVGSSLLLGTITATTAGAAEVTGNVTLATDYVYRGISQTDESATIQGGFDVTSEAGVYAGVWASNIAFDGSIEIDVYAGYGGELAKDVSYDVGVLHYDYPNQPAGQPDSNFNEIYGSLSYRDLTFGAAWSNDFFAETGKATYLYLEYALTLPNDFGLGLHYGIQNIDEAPDYNEYSVSLTRSVGGIDLSLGLYDTDLSKTDCGGDICESRVVFGLSKRL